MHSPTTRAILLPAADVAEAADVDGVVDVVPAVEEQTDHAALASRAQPQT